VPLRCISELLIREDRATSVPHSVRARPGADLGPRARLMQALAPLGDAPSPAAPNVEHTAEPRPRSPASRRPPPPPRPRCPMRLARRPSRARPVPRRGRLLRLDAAARDLATSPSRCSSARTRAVDRAGVRPGVLGHSSPTSAAWSRSRGARGRVPRADAPSDSVACTQSLKAALLLYGPAAARPHRARGGGELGASFISSPSADILDMYIGNSERNLSEIFATARRNAPACCSSTRSTRSGRSAGQLRNNAARRGQPVPDRARRGDAANEGVFVLAATNRAVGRDVALRRRDGSTDAAVLPPDQAARERSCATTSGPAGQRGEAGALRSATTGIRALIWRTCARRPPETAADGLRADRQVG